MTDDHDTTQEQDAFSHVDWAAAWRDAHAKRHHHDSSDYWDERALAFCGGHSNSEYITRFIELLDLQPGESVLDVGCGNGALALPLAQAGHPVIAVDFSPKMLERLASDARSLGLNTIHIIQASWEDDWSAAGVEKADVAIASRSLGVRDLASALRKLDSFAHRRVGLSIPTSHSPRYSKELWDAVGRKSPLFRDHIYCINILFQLGINPELHYISSLKRDRWASFEEARARAATALDDMSPEEQALFDLFCEKHIIQKKDETGQTYWTRDYQREMTWAFISWNTAQRHDKAQS